MRIFKVIALSCGSDKFKRVFSSGDQVTENDFTEGRADKLVRLGFLEEITEAKTTKTDDSNNETESSNDQTDDQTDPGSGDDETDESGSDDDETELNAVLEVTRNEIDGKNHNDFNKTELKKMCDLCKVEYKSSDNKADLLKKLADRVTL